MTDKLTPFELELEAALKQAEHLMRAMDVILTNRTTPTRPLDESHVTRPRVGRTIHSSPFEPAEVVDEPEANDVDGDDEETRS